MRFRGTFSAIVGVSLLLGNLLVLVGCSNHDENEWQRLVCEVSQVNEGVPLVSGYRNAGSDRQLNTDDDFDPIDWVVVQFHARPYSGLITLPEDAPHSYFHITEYDLNWTPLTPGGENLPNFNFVSAPVDVLVPVNEEAEVAVLIADRYMKEFPFIRGLFDSGLWPFQASCELVFRGHETGSDEVIEVKGAFMVSFVGVVIDTN